MKAILFGAYYCGACTTIWNEAFEPLEDDYELSQIDIMRQPSKAHQYNIKRIPTVLVLDGEQEVARIERRMLDADELEYLLKEDI